MNDILAIRKSLEDELTKIEEAIVQAEASVGTDTLDQSSVERLSRIDLGTFGLCSECGATIRQDRLARIPAAVLSGDCMSAREEDYSR